MKISDWTIRSLLLVLLSLGIGTIASGQQFVGIPNGPNDPGNCDYNDPSGCEDKAVFNTSSFDTWYGRWVYFSAQNTRILYNVKYDSNNDGVRDTWRFPTSKVAVDLAGADPDATIALGWVAASGSQEFHNPADGQWYKRVMYFVFQEGPYAGVPAGRVCLSYSNADGSLNDWTAPVAAIFSTSSLSLRGRPCNQQNAEVLVEAISGFRQSSTTNALFALHGDIDIVSNAVGTNRTETYYLTASTNSPDVINVQAMVTSNGLSTPTTPGGDDYNFFVNLDATYDGSKVYLLRVMPYPFDEDSPDTPCSSSGGTFVCPGGLATFPLRGQIYSMDVGANIAATTYSSNQWTLLGDIGSDEGWGVESGGVCSNYPLIFPSQTDYGIDLDSLTVHKLPGGRLPMGPMNLFMGGWTYPDRKMSCSMAGVAGGTWRDAELYELIYSIP